MGVDKKKDGPRTLLGWCLSGQHAGVVTEHTRGCPGLTESGQECSCACHQGQRRPGLDGRPELLPAATPGIA